jgi:hypothetical protein
LLADNSVEPAVDDCIAKRLATFLRRETSPEAAATVRQRICAAKELVPACAVESMLRTICNAWTTTGRFSGPTAVCQLGFGAPEADRSAHFLGCSSLRDMWKDVCPAAAPIFRSLTLAQATLTNPTLSPEEVVQLILWTDVVGQCFKDSKSGNPPGLIQGVAGKNMVIARLRFLGVQCDHSREFVRNMRTMFS